MSYIDAVAEWIAFSEPMPDVWSVYHATALLDTFDMIVAVTLGQNQRADRKFALCRWEDDGGRCE